MVKETKRTCKTCACNRVCAVMYQMGGSCTMWQPRVTFCINCSNWSRTGDNAGYCKAWEGGRMAFHYCGEGVPRNGT